MVLVGVDDPHDLEQAVVAARLLEAKLGYLPTQVCQLNVEGLRVSLTIVRVSPMPRASAASRRRRPRTRFSDLPIGVCLHILVCAYNSSVYSSCSTARPP